MRCLGIAPAIALAALALLAEAAEAPRAALRVAVPALPAALDPATAPDSASLLVVRQVFDTLVQYRDESSDVAPALATQWTVSRDGLAWTFRLRAGVRFHDGTPLTSQHVVESLERQLVPGHALAPAGPTMAPRLLRGAPGVVRAVQAPDARTVRIVLGLPYAPLLTALAHPGLSVVTAAASADGSRRWVGTGPYAVTEAAAGRVALEASDTYWGPAPRIARVVFLVEADEARATAGLAAGDIDVWVPLSAPSRQEGARSVPGWRIGYVALQSERDPFRQRKARQAVAAALDPALVGAAVAPAGRVLDTLLPRGIWARLDAPSLLRGDAALARRLFGEAAVAPGSTVALLMAAGPAAEEQARLAEAMRVALGAAGLRVTPHAVEPAELMRLAQRGEHQMVLLEAEVEAGDPHFLLYPLSTSEGAVKGPQALNLSFYRNSRLDDLLIRGSQLAFRPERQRVYARAQEMLAADVPWVPLYVRAHWVVARPEVKNLRLHPSGAHRLDVVTVE
jgi:peptide/nickel transport system substrate-binding protein